MQKQRQHPALMGMHLADAFRRLIALSVPWRKDAFDRAGNRSQASSMLRATTESAHSVLHAVCEHSQQGALVIFQFDDYARLTRFDSDAAKMALARLHERLAGCLGADVPLASVEKGVFAAWFEGMGPQQTQAQVRAIEYALKQEIFAGSLRIAPTVSLGACNQSGGIPAALLLERALSARSSYRKGQDLPFFEAAHEEARKQRFLIEHEARWAVEREQFSLMLQPVVDAGTGAVLGAEALLRWRHREMGDISPAIFIPVLEEAGLMEDLGNWVVTAACRQLRSWSDDGLGHLVLSANLSAANLQSSEVVKILARQLQRYGVNPACLEVELTETAAMQDVPRTRAVLDDFRSMGISVAIDDFGIGYSSLRTLRDLPFTKLKIDREFASNVDRVRKNQACCRALIELGVGLGLKVVAEGVERAEEVQTLVELGCELFQGYYYAPPLDADQFKIFLKKPFPARRSRGENVGLKLCHR